MTRTIDTNILVRILLPEDSEQHRVAVRLGENHRLIVLSTVLLETEWVLRTPLRFERSRIVELFRHILGSPSFVLEEPGRVAKAFAGFEKGIDFADAMHASALDRTHVFATFDRRLVKRAQKYLPDVSVELAS